MHIGGHRVSDVRDVLFWSSRDESKQIKLQ